MPQEKNGLFLIWFSLLLCACVSSVSNNPTLQAERGVIDLQNWDFQLKGTARLDGGWEFYWNAFVEPERFSQNSLKLAPSYMKVPNSWNAAPAKFPKLGFATYRLKVLTDFIPQGLKTCRTLALKIPEINTAYALFVNGELITQTGVPSMEPTNARPSYKTKAVFFTQTEKDLNIVIHVSNFHFEKGGIWHSIVLGTPGQIAKQRESQKGFELFFTGALFMIAVYHIGLFFLGKREKAFIYFGIFCLLNSLRALVISERVIYDIFPGLNWVFALKMELLPIYLSPPLFLMFIQDLFPKEMNQYVLKLFQLFGLAAGLCILFLPTTNIDLPYHVNQIMIVLACLFCIYVLTRAALQKRGGARLILLGFLGFFLTIINDILYTDYHFQTNNFVTMGLVFFICTEFAIHLKFIKAERQLKAQQEKLIHTDKLVTLGTLVGCVAHEINNPNSSIQLRSEGLEDDTQKLITLARERIPDTAALKLGGYSFEELVSEIPQGIHSIKKNSDRIKKLAQDLKFYSQSQQGTERELVNINKLIDDAIELVAGLIRKQTNFLLKETSPNLPQATLPRQKIEQVIVNLLQNACQALTDKNQGITIRSQLHKNQIVVQVQDQGTGMDKQTLDHVFEPFFTEHAGQGGTGLGLFVAQQIMTEIGGQLKFESKPGKGTTASVFIPLEAAESSKESEAP